MNLGTFVEKNLLGILLALASLATGYFAGIGKAADLERDMIALSARTTAVEAVTKARRPFMSCIVRTIDGLRFDPKAAAPCELEVPE